MQWQDAETGNHIGAIQVAGTAMPSQLPFFVASCDYTLIGEEFFAASAYLSNDPLQIGSLKGQDWGKFVSMLVLIFGIMLVTLISVSHDSEADKQSGFMNQTMSFINDNVLGNAGFLPIVSRGNNAVGDDG